MTPTVPDLDGMLDTQICISALSARRTASQLEAVTRVVTKARGLSVAEYHLLVSLVDLPNRSCRVTELAPRLGVTTGGVTRIIDRAVLRGLVTRAAVTGDGRGALVTLTPHGGDQLTAVVPELAAALRTHLEAAR